MQFIQAIAETTNNFINLIRARGWIFALQAILIHTVLYLLFVPNPLAWLIIFPLFLAYSMALLSYAHMLNSFADQKIDSKVGKSFALEKFPKLFALAILTVTGIISIAVPLLFDAQSIYIGVISFLLATFYSIKPLKLKENGLAGVLTASLASSTLPLLFLVSIIGGNIMLGLFLSISLFFRQFMLELFHQFKDYENDKKTNVKTFAIRLGQDKTKKTLGIVAVFYLIYLLFSFSFGVLEGVILFSVLLGNSIHQITEMLSL